MSKKIQQSEPKAYNHTTVQQAKDTDVPKIFRWKDFVSKLALLFLIVTLVVTYTDKKEYFTADQRNNHVERKWRSFYRFTKKKKEVDMVIFGNSHAMAGVEPFIVSIATGTYCFILGTPGSAVIDTWFGLNEVLHYTKPKIAILETYYIYGGEVGAEWGRIQSFEAKEDAWYKLQMMPYLFKSDDWVKAWSPTIRNHSFLLTNPEQIAFNTATKNKNPDRMRLDLGRFSHGSAHLQDSTIAKYDIVGAPIDGRKVTIAERNQKYLKKIADLCQANDISLVFLTTPEYYRNFDHYDELKATLNAEFQKYPHAKWLDLQSPYDTVSYTKEAFENVIAGYQHSTSYGMEITAYKLADFLSANYASILPDRSNNQTWVTDLREHDHFAFNHDVVPEMSGYTTILKDKTIGTLHVDELVLAEQEKNNRLILKTDKKSRLPSHITVSFVHQHQGQTLISDIEMFSFANVCPPHHNVYVVDVIKGSTVTDIAAIRF
ncbi:MAG: hypothetical protein LBV39_00635 [Bacteroidales bacterium]|jgi:hypothetical protein|nr:hypothetical protein [Bacteroidales bacterium]